MSDASTVTSTVLERLTRALGKESGERYTREGLAELGVHELTTPDELLRFANFLVLKGGVVEAVGHSLKVSALLRGARES